MSVHYLDLAKPFDVRLTVLFGPVGCVINIEASHFAMPTPLFEIETFRAIAFALALFKRAFVRGYQIERIIGELKDRPDFAYEYAVLAAVDRIQRSELLTGTKALFKKGAA